jgi:hypothetical protein
MVGIDGLEPVLSYGNGGHGKISKGVSILTTEAAGRVK